MISDAVFLSDLQHLGMIDSRLASFLRSAVLARCNILVSGPANTGKMVMLRALINAVPAAERLAVVQRHSELRMRHHPELHRDVIEMAHAPPGTGGSCDRSMEHMLGHAMRLNPARVILDELRGPEAGALLTLMRRGNVGCLASVHARSAQDTVHRLATHAAQSGFVSFEVAAAMVSAAVHLVVFIGKNPHPGGRPCVESVLEINEGSAGLAGTSLVFAPSPDDARALRVGDVPIGRLGQLVEHGYLDGPSCWDGDDLGPNAEVV